MLVSLFFYFREATIVSLVCLRRIIMKRGFEIKHLDAKRGYFVIDGVVDATSEKQALYVYTKMFPSMRFLWGLWRTDMLRINCVEEEDSAVQGCLF